MQDVQTLILDSLGIPWVQAGLIFASSLLAAKIVDLVVTRIIRRLARRTATTLDDRIVEHLHRPIFVTMILLGLHLATTRLGLPPTFSGVVLALLKTIGVLLWLGALLRISKLVLEELSRNRRTVGWVEPRTLPLFDNVVKVVLVSGVVYSLLVAWDLDVAPWLASAGIVGIALGFAAKDSLANLFGGLFVIADAPYKLGDYIRLDSGERGRVTHIGLRSTRLLTRDDIEVIIPNAQIANAKIVNESGGPYEKARVTVLVGVAYGSDVDRVRRVLMDAARSVALVAEDPEPRVRFTEFGESSLNFRLLAWVENPEQRGACVDALHIAVYKKFAAEGVEIPFPQRDVHLKPPPPA